MKSRIVETTLLVLCLLIETNSHAQLFGGTIMPKRTTIVIPPTITLGQKISHVIASVYDVDYLPMNETTIPARTGVQVCDGVPEAKVIDIQGGVTTIGLTVNIPVKATGSGTLPAYTSTITVPASLTEDGLSRNLMLSWPAQAYTASTTYISATLAALGGKLNAKKLDINCGIGNDALGVLLGSFNYPYNSAGTTTTFSVRDIAALPDKMFGRTDNGYEVRHDFLYLPISGEDGKVWLNNNLGADYANVNHASFDLSQQATALTDSHAYGSLFQWGRKPDGHELVTWYSYQEGNPVNNSTIQKNDDPTNALFIKNGADTNSDWRLNPDNTLWSHGDNNPCPLGFRVPTEAELTNLVATAGITDYTSAATSLLHFPATGYRNGYNGTIEYEGSRGDYWSSTVNAENARYRSFQSTQTITTSFARAVGCAVRCIKY